MKSSNWLIWGIVGIALYALAKSAQAATPSAAGGTAAGPGGTGYPFVGPINQPGYYPFVGPINQPAATGGGAATNPAVDPTNPALDIQTALWDPCYSGSMVFDPQACTQSGRLTY